MRRVVGGRTRTKTMRGLGVRVRMREGGWRRWSRNDERISGRRRKKSKSSLDVFAS